MDADGRSAAILEFVKHVFPGWPANMTVEDFLLHMTTFHPTLVKFLLMSKHSGDLGRPAYDIFLNPSRFEEMTEELKEIEQQVDILFQVKLNTFFQRWMRLPDQPTATNVKKK